MNIISCDKYENFDSAAICETIQTEKGQFNLYREYIGGIEEDGSWYLDGAAGCIIGLYETSDITASEYHEHTIINGLFELFQDSGEDVRTEEEVYYISFPAISKSLIIENYDSEAKTLEIVDRIKDYMREV